MKYLFAIPNGSSLKGGPREGVRLKKEGVKKGVSDLFFACPSKEFHGLWIELKAKSGKPTQAQLDWLNLMNEAGYAGSICWGWEAARDTILDYLG